MYYIIYGFLWLISKLPWRVIHFLADCFYGLFFYIIKYRRKIVMSNLAIVFPEKTEKERWRIAKGFYHNFIDTFLETIKFISITKEQVFKRSSGNFDLVNNLLAKGYNIHLMAGHQFNWEFVNGLFPLSIKAPFVAIYMPISNKHLERIFFNFRKRFGTVLIAAPDFKNKMHRIFSSQYTFGLAADQNPGDPRNAYWMNFFGRPVPFVTGPAKGAVKNKTAVVMVGIQKIKRGYYQFNMKLLAENGSSFTPQELTILYRNALEDVVRKDPSNYLWSHRRFKYDWKPEYGEIIG